MSSKPSRPPVAAQAAQVRLLADAYGPDAADPGSLPDAMIARQLRNIRFWQDRRTRPGADPAEIDEIIAWSERELAFTRMHRAVFVRALG